MKQIAQGGVGHGATTPIMTSRIRHTSFAKGLVYK